MSRFRVLTTFCLSLAIITSMLLTSASLAADEAVANAQNGPTIMLEPTNLPTDILRRLYPVIPFFAAKAYLSQMPTMKGGKPRDNGYSKFAGWMIFASTFGAGAEIARAATDFGFTAPGSIPQAASAIALFIPSVALNAMGSPVAGQFIAATTNQLGQAFRQKLNESATDIKSYATQHNIAEEYHGHLLESLKTTGGILTLSALSTLQRGHDIASLSDKFGIGMAFTAAYMLRETLTEHFKHIYVSEPWPAVHAATLLSLIGTIGVGRTQPGQMPAMASEALLEAGLFTALVTGINAATTSLSAQVTELAKQTPLANYGAETVKYSLYAISAAVGVYTYMPSIIYPSDGSKQIMVPNTFSKRIRNTIAGTLMLPLAFSATLDAAKAFLSHLSWK